MLFDEISAVQTFEQEQLQSSGILMHPIVVSSVDDTDVKVASKSLKSIESLL